MINVVYLATWLCDIGYGTCLVARPTVFNIQAALFGLFWNIEYDSTDARFYSRVYAMRTLWFRNVVTAISSLRKLFASSFYQWGIHPLDGIEVYLCECFLGNIRRK